MKINRNHLLFILILLLVSVFYGYHHIVLKKPQSIHQWRQADCASIALNYYQDGMDFFHPETHNLTSDGGTTGKCQTSEIPILYYSVAILYQFFGYHDFIFRLLNTLLFFLGLFYLYKTISLLTKDFFWSATITLLIFSSPVLVYYGNNYLSNSTAFSFSLVGWYFFARFFLEKNIRLFYLSVSIFALAAALKVTAFFSLIAIGGIYLAEWIRLKSKPDLKALIYKNKQFILPIFSAFIVIGGWLVYAHLYNQKHQCTYFSTTIFPIWNFDFQSIKHILKQIYWNWGTQYFHPSIFVLIFISTVFIFIHFREKQLSFFRWVIVFIFSEEALYFLLQFWTFRDHDYYTIDMFILPVIILVGGALLLKKKYPRLFQSVWMKIVVVLILVFNLNYAREQIQWRYTERNDYQKNKDLYTITPHLRSIGISPNDTVISIPDGSHVSLYLMNQKGWTEYTDMHFNNGEAYHYNSDSSSIQNSIKHGARYMIINGISELYKKPYLQPFCHFLYGKYNHVLIFKLNTNETNFSLKSRQLKAKYFCDMETLTEDGKYFTNEQGQLFEFGKCQTDQFSYSGKYSIQLNKDNPFGATFRIKNVQPGESLKISVWRKAENDQGTIILSSDGLYHNHFNTIETKNDWEKLEEKFFIDDNLGGKELTIYLYNPNEKSVFFDDFEVDYYKPYRFQTEE